MPILLITKSTLERKKMGEWYDPNCNLYRLRITSNMYADSFINQGEIKFNTPQSWVDHAKDKGEGRGDHYEGAIALCNKTDVEQMRKFDDRYNVSLQKGNGIRCVYKDIVEDKVLYKDAEVMKLPCYCLYMQKVDELVCPDKSGYYPFSLEIPGTFFQDFADHKDIETVLGMKKENQSALILITDFDSFTGRLRKALLDIGVEEHEVVIKYIEYRDYKLLSKDGCLEINCEPPYELFSKRIDFEHQKEARIIINTNKEDVIKRLESPIEIGYLGDIAVKAEGYYPEGLRVEFNAYVEMVNE